MLRGLVKWYLRRKGFPRKLADYLADDPLGFLETIGRYMIVQRLATMSIPVAFRRLPQSYEGYMVLHADLNDLNTIVFLSDKKKGSLRMYRRLSEVPNSFTLMHKIHLVEVCRSENIDTESSKIIEGIEEVLEKMGTPAYRG